MCHILASLCGGLAEGAPRRAVVRPSRCLSRLLLAAEWHRLATLVAGLPGNGKTTFLRALRRVPEWLGVEYVYLAAKEVSTPVRVREEVVLRRIVEVLRPTASQPMMSVGLDPHRSTLSRG